MRALVLRSININICQSSPQQTRLTSNYPKHWNQDGNGDNSLAFVVWPIWLRRNHRFCSIDISTRFTHPCLPTLVKVVFLRGAQKTEPSCCQETSRSPNSIENHSNNVKSSGGLNGGALGAEGDCDLKPTDLRTTPPLPCHKYMSFGNITRGENETYMTPSKENIASLASARFPAPRWLGVGSSGSHSVVVESLWKETCEEDIDFQQLWNGD